MRSILNTFSLGLEVSEEIDIILVCWHSENVYTRSEDTIEKNVLFLCLLFHCATCLLQNWISHSYELQLLDLGRLISDRRLGSF
jgi:hypothetical protein